MSGTTDLARRDGEETEQPMSDEPRELTVREAGRLGGIKARDAGADYQAMGRAGGQVTKARHGRAHYAACGRKGGAANRDKQPPDYYTELGRKGGQRVKELIEKGKAAE